MNKARKFAKKVQRSAAGRITVMTVTILTQVATAVLITALISGILGQIIATIYFLCSIALFDEELTTWLDEGRTL